MNRRILALVGMVVMAAGGQLAAPGPVAASWSGSITVFFATGDGAGRVTSDDGGIDCGYANDRNSGDCSQSYVFPDSVRSVLVTITYTPATGSHICVDSAGGCVTNGAPHSVTLEFRPEYSNTVTLTPSFRLNSYRVQVEIDGPGTISSPGDSCMPDAGYDFCRRFKHGTSVTLAAAPDGGSTFNFWFGSPCDAAPRDATCTFSVTRPVELTAVFGRTRLFVERVGSGGVCIRTGVVVECTGRRGSVNAWFLTNSAITLTTHPDDGWRFSKWNQAPCEGQGATCAFTLTDEVELKAKFTQIPAATATPKPTPKPTPPPTPRPTPRPTPGQSSTVAPATSIPPSQGAVVPSATPLDSYPPSDAPVATPGESMPEGSASPDPEPTTPPLAADVDTGDAQGAAMVLLGLLIGIGAAALLALGLLLGRRRNRQSAA